MNNLFQIYSFIFGSFVGSFLSVVIIRLPKKMNLSTDRSKCPKCSSQLKWYHNIPILSFLFLSGKCGFCHTKISWRYPLIEILTGLISFWLFPESLDALSIGIYLSLFFMACIFICHFFIDLDHHLLLDSLNLYLLVLVGTYTFFFHPWNYWLIGGAIGFLAPLTVTWLFYKIRGQVGLGGGDIKLYGILGLMLGPLGIVLNIFLSCMLGAIIGITLIAFKKMDKDKPMPFGPSILLIASLQIFFPGVAAQISKFILP